MPISLTYFNAAREYLRKSIMYHYDRKGYSGDAVGNDDA